MAMTSEETQRRCYCTVMVALIKEYRACAKKANKAVGHCSADFKILVVDGSAATTYVDVTVGNNARYRTLPQPLAPGSLFIGKVTDRDL